MRREERAVPYSERVFWFVFLVGIVWAAALTRKGGPDLLAWVMVTVWTALCLAGLTWGMWIDRDQSGMTMATQKGADDDS